MDSTRSVELFAQPALLWRNSDVLRHGVALLWFPRIGWPAGLPLPAMDTPVVVARQRLRTADLVVFVWSSVCMAALAKPL